MKTYSLLAFLLVFAVVGCSKKGSKEQTTESVTDSLIVVDEHNARISLDYIGEYNGVLPCADCEGIETSLALTDESNYTLKTKYLGKGDDNVFEEKGTYTWNDAGNTIVFSDSDKPNQYFVGENTLTQLDLEGNKISGNLADKYVLTKAVVATMISSVNNPELSNTKWLLIELHGKPIKKPDTSTEDLFIQFDDQGGYTAYAGCNRMAGRFISEKPLIIKFEKGISTLMACPDMDIEQEFAKVLETADNYTIGNDNLSLNKARMAPLARFTKAK